MGGNLKKYQRGQITVKKKTNVSLCCPFFFNNVLLYFYNLSLLQSNVILGLTRAVLQKYAKIYLCFCRHFVYIRNKTECYLFLWVMHSCGISMM